MLNMTTSSRDDIIRIGCLIAEISEAGFIVGLDGDAGSGKELIALASDHLFRPHLYSEGIPPEGEITADDLHHDETPDYKGPVAFQNWRRDTRLTQAEYDKELRLFRSSCDYAKLLYASNLERTVSGFFNYSAGVQSDVLGMNIRVLLSRPDDRSFTDIVNKVSKHWDRRIEITTACPKLRQRIAKKLL